jgi:hypothetical protein
MIVAGILDPHPCRLDRTPGPLPGRHLDGLHQGLDAHNRTKAERLRRRSGYRAHKTGNLDRLKVVEPDLVAGGPDELAEGELAGPASTRRKPW